MIVGGSVGSEIAAGTGTTNVSVNTENGRTLPTRRWFISLFDWSGFRTRIWSCMSASA